MKEIFKAVTESVEGLKVKCTARQMVFLLDEPENLGGTNEGMNPVEALLSALGACKCIVAQSFAKAHKIKLKAIRIEEEGVLDPDGFLGKNKDAKIGFSEIKSTFYVEADNTPDEIEAFIHFVERTCPVQDSLQNAPAFKHEIRLNEKAVGSTHTKNLN